MEGLLRSLGAVMIFSKSQQFFVWGRKCLWVAMAKSAIPKKNEKANPVFGENDDDEKMKTQGKQSADELLKRSSIE